MKYKILEKPNCEDAYDLVQEALRKKATILIFACCKVNYEGRALSELGRTYHHDKAGWSFSYSSGKES